MLWEISVTVKHLIMKASPPLLSFTTLEAEQKMLVTMHENDLFDIFPDFSKVVDILVVIPATSCAAERSLSALCR